MRQAAFVCLAVGVLAILNAAVGRAALYHPTDRTAVISVDDDGRPEALPFDVFKLRRLVLRNASNPEWPLIEIDPETKQQVIDPKTGQPRLSDRGVVAERIKAARAKPKRTLIEDVGLAVDLLRFGKADEAAGIFQDNRSGYLPNITLAHISIAQDSRDRPSWGQAFNYLDIANEEAPLKEWPGISPLTLAWYAKLNQGALMKFIRLRLAETRGAKLPPEDELPDRLFDVDFHNDAAVYQPGVLSESERAKLPPDAIATVQQLVLWFPNDIRLYWLLGELYAAKGDFKSALDIMNECVDSGRYSNRKVLMQHREAVKKAYEESQPVDVKTPLPLSWRTVWIYLGVLGGVVLLAIVRSILKARRKRGA